MALGFFVKEVAKAIAIGAGAEILRERVIPPVAKKIKEKLNGVKEKSESKEEEKEPQAREYVATWE